MIPTAIPSLADRFALIIDGLRRVVARRQAATGLAAPLIILLWNRLGRSAARFAAVAARIQSGALPSPGRRRRRTILPLPLAEEGRAEGVAPRPAPPRPQRRLPRAFGWLIRLLPEAASYRSQLQHLLSDPELAAQMSAAPQIGRILRPLCHMLGLRFPKFPDPSPGPVLPERVEPNPGSPGRSHASHQTTAHGPPRAAPRLPFVFRRLAPNGA